MMQVYGGVLEATVEQNARFGIRRHQRTLPAFPDDRPLVSFQIDPNTEEQTAGVQPNRRGRSAPRVRALPGGEEQRRKPHDAFQEGVRGRETHAAPRPD